MILIKFGQHPLLYQWLKIMTIAYNEILTRFTYVKDNTVQTER